MTGSPVFASVDPASASPPDRVLVCGVNWIGDTVMSLPALQRFRRLHPGTRVTLLTKPPLAALWAMSPAIDEVLPLHGGLGGTMRTAAAVRAGRFSRAFVLPHSFRSALIPFLAGVPERVGLPGHCRDAMLTRVVRPAAGPGRMHQAWEYMDLLAPGGDGLEAPVLRPGAEAAAEAAALLPEGRAHWVGFLPGAARGPSKRWPAGHFIELGHLLCADGACRIAVMGAAGEADLCRQVTEGIGRPAVNLAGRTSLAAWAAALAACRIVVSNDSGGMHLAAALGTPVIALFGITDPDKTGPLGNARILQRAERRGRDVPRDSREARLSLASIRPGEVYEAVCEQVEKSP